MAIVEHLDVIEDGVGEFEASSPALAVEQFDLHARPKALHHRVNERVTDRAERGQQPRFAYSLLGSALRDDASGN